MNYLRKKFSKKLTRNFLQLQFTGEIQAMPLMNSLKALFLVRRSLILTYANYSAEVKALWHLPLK